ncbi:MAG: hypothetical protein PWQ39_486 [Thermacetogenium sp.]|nr:hypothetical protein [Thermacetogenium sp.]
MGSDLVSPKKMPYDWVEAPLFFEHKGVKVYHLYKNDIMDNGTYKYWYAPYPWSSDGDQENFDVRDLAKALHLPEPESQEEIQNVLRQAVDAGLLTENGVKD